MTQLNKKVFSLSLSLSWEQCLPCLIMHFLHSNHVGLAARQPAAPNTGSNGEPGYSSTARNKLSYLDGDCRLQRTKL